MVTLRVTALAARALGLNWPLGLVLIDFYAIYLRAKSGALTSTAMALPFEGERNWNLTLIAEGAGHLGRTGQRQRGGFFCADQ